MAITVNGARFIAAAIRRGARLGNLVTIGRQGLYAPKSVLNDILASAGLPRGFPLGITPGDLPWSGEWADELYSYFGASQLTVLDGSPYEGAALVHDLNQLLPRELEGRFECLIDGGSLEHIFNIPEALSSYLKIIKVGGYIIMLDMPATNLCGHGFYQFSPALFWQVFSEKYGFEILDIAFAETRPFADFWGIQNPADIGRRVELVNDRPCHLFVAARKCGTFKGFNTSFPIQHDYSTAWVGEKINSAGRRTGAPELGLLQRFLSTRAPRLYWRLTNFRNMRRQLRAMRLDGGKAGAPYRKIAGLDSTAKL
jgi:hypothetical protein